MKTVGFEGEKRDSKCCARFQNRENVGRLGPKGGGKRFK